MSDLSPHSVDQSDAMKAMVTIVRSFLRDWEPINELLEGEESRDRDIVLGIIRCIEDFNGTSPITSYTLASLLSLHQLDLLIQGSACNVVQSVYFPYMRNEVSYSDAGMNIKVQGKQQDLLNWYRLTKNEYEQKKRSTKNALNQAELLNSAAGMSGIPSEFWILYESLKD